MAAAAHSGDDALASQARKGALVLVHQRAVAARGPRSCGGADREHRVGQDEHRRLRALREHLVRPRERVVDGGELACVVGALGGSEELGRLFVGDDASRFFVERRRSFDQARPLSGAASCTRTHIDRSV